MDICPVMSGGKEQRGCIGKGCNWWSDDDEACGVKMMALDAMKGSEKMDLIHEAINDVKRAIESLASDLS